MYIFQSALIILQYRYEVGTRYAIYMFLCNVAISRCSLRRLRSRVPKPIVDFQGQPKLLEMFNCMKLNELRLLKFATRGSIVAFNSITRLTRSGSSERFEQRPFFFKAGTFNLFPFLGKKSTSKRTKLSRMRRNTERNMRSG